MLKVQGRFLGQPDLPRLVVLLAHVVIELGLSRLTVGSERANVFRLRAEENGGDKRSGAETGAKIVLIKSQTVSAAGGAIHHTQLPGPMLPAMGEANRQYTQFTTV